MKTTLFLVGLGAAGVYFLDSKKGKKRRALFTKNFKNVFDQAGDYCSDLADRSKPLISEIRKQSKPFADSFSQQSQKYASQLGHSVYDYAKNGHTGWNPSARLTGATAGALALYGAGRPGFVGALLRTLSLGFFTRALLASH
ncbi:YtxH domain-containing protein [bacterium]|nr:YtxH domain-containing protein [bacterium]MCI0603153.1 YtxH domain-containing protein [bacterium]